MPSREYHESLWEGVPEGATPTLAERRLRFLLDRVSVGEHVLDVGCGEGWFAGALIDAGAEVVGVDVAQEPLRRAAARRKDLDLRLLPAVGAWPLADASFDVVWAGEVVEHVCDTTAWLSEVRRVIRPKGRLLISTPAHDSLSMIWLSMRPAALAEHFDPRSDHLRFYTRRSLRGLLEDFRFEDVAVDGVGGLPRARSCLLVSAVRSRF